MKKRNFLLKILMCIYLVIHVIVLLPFMLHISAWGIGYGMTDFDVHWLYNLSITALIIGYNSLDSLAFKKAIQKGFFTKRFAAIVFCVNLFVHLISSTPLLTFLAICIISGGKLSINSVIFTLICMIVYSVFLYYQFCIYGYIKGIENYNKKEKAILIFNFIISFIPIINVISLIVSVFQAFIGSNILITKSTIISAVLMIIIGAFISSFEALPIMVYLGYIVILYGAPMVFNMGKKQKIGYGSSQGNGSVC